MSEGIFTLDRSGEAHARAAEAFDRLKPELAALLPVSADIIHVGATAVPGCLTKGDLDVAVRVPDEDFEIAEAALSARFPRNHGSVQTMDFAAFEVRGANPETGIQLAVIGGPFDHFHVFGPALLAHPALLEGYNELKTMFEGQPMETYRAAKALFINAVIDGVARGEIPL